MKKILLCAAACMLLLLPSCQQDAPEIDFEQNTVVEVDLSEVIDAINDLSMNVTEKMNMIKSAIESSTTTLSEKLDVLTAALETQTLTLGNKIDLLDEAVREGFVDVNSLLGRIIELFEDHNATFEEKLGAIEAAINSQTVTLGGKLDLIQQAIESQTLTLSEKLGVLQSAIVSQMITLGGKLDLIQKAIDELELGGGDKEELARKALLEELGKSTGADHWTMTEESVDAVNEALRAIGFPGGGVTFGYEGDPQTDVSDFQHFTMDRATWEALIQDEELDAAFAATMTPNYQRPIRVFLGMRVPGSKVEEQVFGPAAEYMASGAQMVNADQSKLFALYNTDPQAPVVVVYTYIGCTLSNWTPAVYPAGKTVLSMRISIPEISSTDGHYRTIDISEHYPETVGSPCSGPLSFGIVRDRNNDRMLDFEAENARCIVVYEDFALNN